MGYKRRSDASRDGGTKPSLDLFMILGNILVDKDMALYESHVHNELFPSTFSAYMVLRYLTMNANNLVRNLVLNHLYILEGMADKPELLYKVLLKIVPRTHNRFTPYIRSGFLPSASSKTSK